MPLQIRALARTLGQEGEEYCPAGACGLSVRWGWGEGDGSPGAPRALEVSVRNDAAEDWRGVVQLQLLARQEAPRFFLPGFLYGTNGGERPLSVPHEFPRIRAARARPASPWWMMQANRLAAPAAFLYDGGRIRGFSAGPYWVRTADGRRCAWTNRPEEAGADFERFAGYACAVDCTLPGETGSFAALGYTLGYENAPWHFIQAHRVWERAPLSEESTFPLRAGEEVTFRLEVWDYPAQAETALGSALRAVYDRYHQSPRVIGGMSVPRAAADLAEALSRDAWLEEEQCYSGFVRERADGKGFDYNKIPSLAWTNGLPVAVPVLAAALRLGREEMRAQAIACIDHLISVSRNERSGLPYETVDADGRPGVRGWWFDGMRTPGHAVYLSGQAAFYALKAWRLEREQRSCDHPEWLAFARGIVRRLARERNTDGEYPFVCSEQTGAGLEYDAMGGCWALAAAACYCALTGDREDLDGLLASERHYYRAYVRRMECYGGPLDTDKAVDSEGVLSYLRAVRYLHTVTGAPELLVHMRDALEYEFSFRFGYCVPLHVPPLGRLGWSTSGGSITSVANPHIHPMSCTVTDELLYYAEQTGDAYVRSRARDTVLWGCQTYNTRAGEYDYGRRGWMSERFCYSPGLLVERYPDGSPASTWFALMSWAAASVLEGLTGAAWEAAAAKL